MIRLVIRKCEFEHRDGIESRNKSDRLDDLMNESNPAVGNAASLLGDVENDRLLG